MWLRSAFLLVLVAGLALPLAADEDTMRLKIQVRSLGDRPIDRAAVIVDFVEGRSIVKLGKKVIKHWEVRSNQEGMAKIPSLPRGKVRVQVVAKGYQTFGQTYDIDEAEKTIEVQLNPPQPQYSAH